MPSVIQADQLKSANGNTTYLNSGTLSNVTLPSGSIVNVWSYQASSAVVISNTGTQETNTDSLTNVATTRRVYAKIANITVNISSGNDLIINAGS